MTNKTIMLLACVLLGCDSRACVRSHEEKRHRGAFVTVVIIGKTRIPIIHPARDYTVTVCDEYGE